MSEDFDDEEDEEGGIAFPEGRGRMHRFRSIDLHPQMHCVCLGTQRSGKSQSCGISGATLYCGYHGRAVDYDRSRNWCKSQRCFCTLRQ